MKIKEKKTINERKNKKTTRSEKENKTKREVELLIKRRLITAH